ncbi:MAG: M14 family zinc carboxypeptidase [Phycisphaerales bacterium]
MDRVRSQLARISLLVGLLAISGCYEPEPKPIVMGELPPLVLPPAEAPPAQHRLVGRSIQGRPIMIQILGQGDDTVLVMGAIHGNEPASATLVNGLIDYLRTNRDLLEGRRVVLIPVANPDGLAAGTRENIRRIDLNRNFEAANRVDDETNGLRPLSEPESRALQSVIKEYTPSRIVSIHQPLTCIDFDGPGRALATRMAQYCDLPLKKLGAKPGSLGSYTGESLGIATITVELPAEASKQTEQILWDKYGKALLAAVLFPQRPL